MAESVEDESHTWRRREATGHNRSAQSRLCSFLTRLLAIAPHLVGGQNGSQGEDTSTRATMDTGYPVTVAGSRISFPCWIPDIRGYPAGYPVTVAGSRAGAFFPDSYYNIKFSRGTRISRPPAPSSLARILGGGRIPSPSERFCPGLRPSGVPSPDAGSDTLPFRKILSGPATIRGPVP